MAQLWPLQPACSQNRAGSYMLDPTSHIQISVQFHFSKEGQNHTVQNGSGSGSNLDGLVRYWAKASCPEASWCARITGPCFLQNATSLLPVSHFQTQLHSSTVQTAQILLCKTSPDAVGFWQAVSGFGQTDPIWKQASVQESSGPLLANASKPFWIRRRSDPAYLLGIQNKKKVHH